MDNGLRELARTLASLTDAEYREVTSEARGPEADRIVARQKADRAGEMTEKAALLRKLIDQQQGF